MTKQHLTILAIAALTMLASCKEKKNTVDIIAETVEVPKPSGPISMQPYNDQREVQWLGKTYSVEINRHPSDSLPMVTDETGQKFVDNVIRLTVRRADGSVAISKTFLKKTFDAYLDNGYRQHGILEGLVFDKTDGDWLEFAASVSHPQTDEYIPLIVRLSRLGDVMVKHDVDMDTNAFAEDSIE